jgi:AcrR family transcriptional regulator
LPIDKGAVLGEGREIAREQVQALQRRRLFDAMAQVLTERGLRGTTATLVCTRAEVSPSAFRKLFASVDDCFLALLEQVRTRSTALMVDAFERETSWEEGVLAGLEALLVFLDAEPALARVCLVEGLAGPPAALRQRVESLRRLKPLLDGSRERMAVDRQPPEMAADAAIAAVAGILHTKLVEEQAPPFIALLGELAGVVVAPYLGGSAARKQTERGKARALVLARETRTLSSEPIVTIPKAVRHGSSHRRRLCLAYLAENPGSSNQAIAAGIDVPHPGQISTALSRLKDAGLLTLRAGGAGLANAWWLSSQGEQVARTLGYC